MSASGVRHYVEELVYTETEDGITHAGAIIRPATGAVKSLAVVYVHGGGSTFYTRDVVNLGRELAGHGYVFITGNNRGHDYGIILTPKGKESMLYGTGWSHFPESPLDVAAWIDFAGRAGFPRIVLLGHSWGAAKVVHYQSQRQDGRVAGLVVASDRIHPWYPEPELVAEARRMVAEGRGDHLVYGFGHRIPCSAQCWVDAAEKDQDPYGVETPNPQIARIRCPLLACVGTVGERTTPEDLEIVKRNATGAPRVDTMVFEGANHGYVGHEPQVAAALAAWMDSLS